MKGATAGDRRIKFTRSALDALELPATGRVYYYDTVQPGLAVSVGPTGQRTFYLVKKVAGVLEQIELKRDGVIDIDGARKAARAQQQAVAAGANPADARRASRTGKTLREVFNTSSRNAGRARGDG